jgi:hypothetical protein
VDIRGEDTDRDAVRVYDQGVVSDVKYTPTRIKTENADDEPNFDRRPLLDYAGHMREVPVDRGRSSSLCFESRCRATSVLSPARVFRGSATASARTRTRAASRRWEISTGVDGYRVSVNADRRWESSPIHLMALARMSDLEVLNFYGYGNETPGGSEDYFDVKQRQWLFNPGDCIRDRHARRRGLRARRAVFEPRKTCRVPARYTTLWLW